MPERAGSKILAIAGGSCSGKTSLANMVVEALGQERSTIIRTDDYYRADLFGRSADDPVNFDLPSALDVDLLHGHLLDLKRGEAVDGPVWDFVSHRRRRETVRYEPKDVIVVEGILALHARQLATLYDHSCFIECAENVRLERRIVRDVAERGRTMRSVREQFAAQVAPMHDEFVEPTRSMARRIVLQQEYCADARAIADELISTVIGEGVANSRRSAS